MSVGERLHGHTAGVATARISATGRLAGKLAWYSNRLRLMSFPEVLHRAQQTLHKRLMHAAAARLAPVPVPQRLQFGLPWCELPHGLDPAPYVRAADEVLAGRWNVFALRGAPLGFPPQWNVDPLTGTRAPMEFGMTLDYRDEARVGNIKYLWEPSRHLELTTLAQAWHLSHEVRFLDGCRTLLTSWFNQCPYPLGVHWSSALELAIRLVNWAISWHLLGGADSPLFVGESGRTLRDRWMQQVWRHAEFIRGNLSRYSSANNHLLGEYMGLWIAGLTWDCWGEALAWRDIGYRGFGSEALLQNAPDGVNREQGIYYHHEVADMMLLCGLYGAANSRDFPPPYWARLEAMIGFIAAVSDRADHVPMFGDADDALMVRFDPTLGFDPYRSLRATGTLMFGRDFGTLPGDDIKTAWLLGTSPPRRRSSLTSMPRAFPDGGYWILADQRGQPGEIRIVADAGALGYLSLAAHGHADALSFVLSLDGREILIDPGTYAYHTEQDWRDHFRGTAAHNTVRVDRQDQSVIGGNFMWLHKAQARCLAFDTTPDRDHWVAEHDGYTRLRDPVMHRRAITLTKGTGQVEVVDTLACRGHHDIELFWHFAEDCNVTVVASDTVQARVGQRKVLLRCPGWNVVCSRGEVEPICGWVSRRFGHKQPASTVSFSGRIDGATAVTTWIGPASD